MWARLHWNSKSIARFLKKSFRVSHPATRYWSKPKRVRSICYISPSFTFLSSVLFSHPLPTLPFLSTPTIVPYQTHTLIHTLHSFNTHTSLSTPLHGCPLYLTHHHHLSRHTYTRSTLTSPLALHACLQTPPSLTLLPNFSYLLLPPSLFLSYASLTIHHGRTTSQSTLYTIISYLRKALGKCQKLNPCITIFFVI